MSRSAGPTRVAPRPAERATAAPAAFADKLKSAGAPTARARPAAKTGGKEAARATSATADLAADLKAGKISPQAAVDRVIDRVVDKQLGTDAPAGVREKLRAALETAVADDPLLADKTPRAELDSRAWPDASRRPARPAEARGGAGGVRASRTSGGRKTPSVSSWASASISIAARSAGVPCGR